MIPHTDNSSNTQTLFCLIGNYFLFLLSPTPRITWERRGGSGHLPVGRHYIQNYGTELLITDIQEKDEGSYVCRGSNAIGEATSTIAIDVQCKDNSWKIYFIFFKKKFQNIPEKNPEYSMFFLTDSNVFLCIIRKLHSQCVLHILLVFFWFLWLN